MPRFPFITPGTSVKTILAGLATKKVLQQSGVVPAGTYGPGATFDVTAIHTGQTPVLSASTTEGTLVNSPDNKVVILDSATKEPLETPAGEQIFGRLTNPGMLPVGPWTLSLYIYSAGVEVPYALTAGVLIDYYYVIRTNLRDVAEEFAISDVKELPIDMDKYAPDCIVDLAGATGTHTTIAAALAACPAGGKIFVKPGDYSGEGTITISTATTLLLDNTAIVSGFSVQNDDVIIEGGTIGTVTYVDNRSRCKLKSSAVTTLTQTGVMPTLINCDISDNTIGLWTGGGRINSIKVMFNRFIGVNAGGWQVDLSWGGGSSNAWNWFIGNHFATSGTTHAIRFQADSQFLIFAYNSSASISNFTQDCYFQSIGPGLVHGNKMNSLYGASTRADFTDNEFGQFQLTEMHEGKIDGNWFSTSLNPNLYVMNTYDGCVIINNHVALDLQIGTVVNGNLVIAHNRANKFIIGTVDGALDLIYNKASEQMGAVWGIDIATMNADIRAIGNHGDSDRGVRVQNWTSGKGYFAYNDPVTLPALPAATCHNLISVYNRTLNGFPIYANDPTTLVAGDTWFNSTSQQWKGYNGMAVVIIG